MRLPPTLCAAALADAYLESAPFPLAYFRTLSLTHQRNRLSHLQTHHFPQCPHPPTHPFFRLVHHPHIVRLEDVYEGAGEDGNMYIVTELLEGGELFTALVGRAR